MVDAKAIKEKVSRKINNTKSKITEKDILDLIIKNKK